ncbi:MAG: RNA pseudouridine synthase [Treponema sp.]|nr:RNA pseudouridine synthase [Treponema sp.]
MTITTVLLKAAKDCSVSLSGFEAAPYLVDESSEYIVVYKPSRMHSVPLKGDSEAPEAPKNTLLDWCVRFFPEVQNPRGKQSWEGGILHRLDYETQGLVLFAKTQRALENLRIQQEEGRFIKFYSALGRFCCAQSLPGFPGPPQFKTVPFTIASGFRAFGPARQSVRPVVDFSARRKHIALDRGNLYCTEILEQWKTEDYTCFHVQIRRGFRHQIRCHLAWIRFPLLNDTLYGGFAEKADNAPLGLTAWAIAFYDPVSGKSRCYKIFPHRGLEFIRFAVKPLPLG